MFIFFVLTLKHLLVHCWCQCCCYIFRLLKMFSSVMRVWLLLLLMLLLLLLFELECIFSVPLWFIAHRDTFTYYCGFGVSQKIPHFVVKDGCCCYFTVEYLVMHKLKSQPRYDWHNTYIDANHKHTLQP